MLTFYVLSNSSEKKNICLIVSMVIRFKYIHKCNFNYYEHAH